MRPLARTDDKWHRNYRKYTDYPGYRDAVMLNALSLHSQQRSQAFNTTHAVDGNPSQAMSKLAEN